MVINSTSYNCIRCILAVRNIVILIILITLLYNNISSCQNSEVCFFNMNIYVYTKLYSQWTLYAHRTDCNSNLIYYYVQISIAGPYV